MGDKILLTEYAQSQNIPLVTARQRAQRGAYKTAVKIGRDWFIDSDDMLSSDGRVKSGEFKDWRKPKLQDPPGTTRP